MDQKSNLASSLGEIVGLLTEIRDGLSVVSSQLASIKEERRKIPHTPLKKKGGTNNNDNACAREKFKKPTVEEVAAYIREKGYTFDAEAFWNYYESKGWIVGRTPMKKWRSACVTWQRHAQAEQRSAARPAARRRPSNWIAPTPEQVKEFEDDFS